MPDFRLQTIGCEAIIAWHLISNFLRLPKSTLTSNLHIHFPTPRSPGRSRTFVSGVKFRNIRPLYDRAF
jgi:hypothetical protein